MRPTNSEAEVKSVKNYKTDYKPLVEFARKNALPFIATNIPRRYASMVSRGGFEELDSLNAEAKRFIAPLPALTDPELKCYKDKLCTACPARGAKPNENFPKAQAIKDATMAHFIAENLTDGKTFIHYNGSYHSDNYLGIIHYPEAIQARDKSGNHLNLSFRRILRNSKRKA
ncbi:MAG: ChaN family lipoprotein [Bacteroidales bacterium]